MSAITLQQAAQWCGGKVDPRYAQVTFDGACNDSRTIAPGQLFVALTTQTADGNDYVPNAIAAGASAALCSREMGDYPAIVVPDVRLALGQIAREQRKRLGIRVVGITGSVGKSTTKEMVVLVLSKKYRTAKTPVNHNNDIGMPMAVLAMPEDTQVGVLEMGMNHFGEMSYLTSIAQPDVAVIVNIGTMHIEHLGSREGILKAKLEILEGLKPGGTTVYCGDEPLLWELRNTQSQKITYFGIQNPENGILATGLQERGETIACQVRTPQGSCSMELPVVGEHLVCDAMAAVAVGLEMGVPLADIASALRDFRPMEGRLEISEYHGYTIIRDCYNAGPESMAASLRVLGKRAGRKIAVLGDMLELGGNAQAEHYKVGRIAAAQADMVFALGHNAKRVVSGALTGGMAPRQAMAFASMEELTRELLRRTKPGDVLLFKGSRGMRMERALECFLKEK